MGVRASRGRSEPLLKALIDGGAGIETLAIERPGLHDAFVAIAGNEAAAAMGAGEAAMMRFVRSAFVIARRDFAATVLSKAFIFFLLGPLFPLLLGGVFGGIGASVASQTEQPVVAVVVAAEPSSTACRRRASSIADALGDEPWSTARRTTRPKPISTPSRSACSPRASRRSARC